ncbi:hypothetical protein [Vibrio quintilis]|uniref:Uncharacterized protein n=1 Tax=Vibrio quintilis TaxID=1117707 RepID=A0A1M7Z2R9_9VIBR|nr:hypothetical protein [Vibrio quintilis]SHO59259.1 hypothetical protein VQ7734_05039 [Vibrio quintilis]
MATLNATVQEMIDSLHTKMKAGTLKAEEQMLIGKGLEALMNNASWEKALIAVAEDNISESKALLNAARDELQTAKTVLTESITQIKQHYSPLITVGSLSQISTIAAGKSLTITPPSGCRVRVFQLVALSSNKTGMAAYHYVKTTLGSREFGTRIAGTQAASAAYTKVGAITGTPGSFSAPYLACSNKELLGKVDEKLTLENTSSSVAYLLIGVDFVTGDY